MFEFSEELIDKMTRVAVYHLDGERWGEALRALDELVKARPESWEFRFLRSEALRRLDRHEEAMGDAKLAAEAQPDNDDVSVALAELYMLNYQFPEAVKILNVVFNKGYDPTLPPNKQPPLVQRAGFSLAVIQRVGTASEAVA